METKIFCKNFRFHQYHPVNFAIKLAEASYLSYG